jgi:hypothetical protein
MQHIIVKALPFLLIPFMEKFPAKVVIRGVPVIVGTIYKYIVFPTFMAAANPFNGSAGSTALRPR